MDDLLLRYRKSAVVEASYTDWPVVLKGRPQFERWERGQQIGEGSFGKVYLERHKDKCRAVKRLEKNKYVLKEIRAIAMFSEVCFVGCYLINSLFVRLFSGTGFFYSDPESG